MLPHAQTIKTEYNTPLTAAQREDKQSQISRELLVSNLQVRELLIRKMAFQNRVSRRAGHLEFEQMTSGTAQHRGICHEEYN